MKKNKKFFYAVSAFCVISVLIWIISCAVNPVTGKKEFMLLTEADESALGAQTDGQIVETYGVYENAELNQYINDIGKRMGKLTHRPNLKYSYKVLDTPVVNAFAVPGGYVYFTRGILCYLNNEAELAGVMGHELGHVNARHSAKQYSKAQLAQLGLGIGVVLSENFRKYAGLAQFGVQLMFLKFSRDNEREADDLGVLYSTRTGYDALNMATFFETLERMHPSSGANALPEWFSTHPNPVDRIGSVRRKATELKQKSTQTLVTNRDQYLKQLDGLVFGEDPRQGYVDGNTFYHPTMRFMFPVPQGWTVNNTPAQIQIVSPQQDAALLMALDENSTPAIASQAFVQNASATVLENNALQVNGLAAQKLVTLVPQESDTLQVASMFVKKDNQVFAFHGLSSRAQFKGYRGAFESAMSNFKNLTDPGKMNVKPAQLKIVQTNGNVTLRSLLTQNGTAADQLEELAVVNGMQLNQNVDAKTLVKVVNK
ncbi:M48 family metalloprotease [candidate division KSB1 bacterium]|nr:M48 family metalloprotease [candidate division KSB1 bacterium]